MKKKGQAEIFGLIIITLLLIFALLFFVKIKQDETSSVTIRSNFRANNLLNAIVKLNTEETGNMREILRNCLKIKNCGNEESTLVTIIESALMLNEKYEFKASFDGYEKEIAGRGICEEGIAASPIRFPEGGILTLKICS